MYKKFLAFAFAMMACVGVSTQAASPARTAIPTDQAEDEEDDQPYVEPPFTVTINIDNADAVYFTVNEQPIAHHQGDNVITVDPGTGYIKVHVNEGYVFTRFYDEEQQSDYLQYNRQTMPVTVRKTISTGMSEEDVILVDGHHFTVETLQLTEEPTYSLTVTVDHADLARMAIGTGYDFESGANRRIPLSDGTFTITYNESDTYLHITGESFMHPLRGVTFNGHAVASDGQMNSVYTIQLKGEKTANGEIVITTYDVSQGLPCSFTATIDDASFVRFFTRMPANKEALFHSGDNVIYFAPGDTFEVWCSYKAASCTFNGTNIAFDSMKRYCFTPTDGGHLDLRFGFETAHIVMVIDSSDSDFTTFMCTDGSSEWYPSLGRNEIEFKPALEGNFYFRAVPEPAAVYLNGESIFNGESIYGDMYYIFTPADGDIVRVYMDDEPETHNVVFDIDENVADSFIIKRENIQQVDHMAGFASELHGTVYSIIPEPDTELIVTLSNPMMLLSDDSDKPEGINVPLVDGAHTFALTGHTTVSVAASNSQTGIGTVAANASDAPILYFDLQGRSVDASALRPGIYLRRQGTSVTKIILR